MQIPFRRAGLVLIAAGGAGLIGLVGWFGARQIGAEVLRAAWALPAAVALHGVQLLLSSVAWRGLVGGPPGQMGWFRIRWVREAVNTMLPVAQIGGNLAAIRMLTRHGQPLPRAAAATVLDLTLEALTLFLFTLLGIATLAAISPDHAWRPWLGGGLAVMAAALGGFVLAQRAGMFRLIERLAERLGAFLPGLPPGALAGLHGELMALHRRHAAIARAVAIHFTGWLLGAMETWIAFAAMDQPCGVLPALVIQSLGMAARNAGFAVPGALGVQEAGFVLAAGLFGIPADAAIAMSMVKRARELACGLPGLVVWQWDEVRRWARRTG